MEREGEGRGGGRESKKEPKRKKERKKTRLQPDKSRDCRIFRQDAIATVIGLQSREIVKAFTEYGGGTSLPPTFERL